MDQSSKESKSKSKPPLSNSIFRSCRQVPRLRLQEGR